MRNFRALMRRPTLILSGLSGSIFLALFHPALANSPIPFEYTRFGQAVTSDEDAYWARGFSTEPETIERGKSFAAHIGVQRPGFRQAIAAYYSQRTCKPLVTKDGFAIARCPALLITAKPGAAVETKRVDDICLVTRGTNPPVAVETGWNASQATLVVEGGQAKMVISAVFGGELLTDCNVTVPLGPGLSPPPAPAEAKDDPQ
jgi:hypothetical protein